MLSRKDIQTVTDKIASSVFFELNIIPIHSPSRNQTSRYLEYHYGSREFIVRISTHPKYKECKHLNLDFVDPDIRKSKLYVAKVVNKLSLWLENNRIENFLE